MKIILAVLLLFTLNVKPAVSEYRNFTATAYTIKGKTASGTRTRRGIIAADPKILPLGTKVHIEGQGVFVVADTGGAIKGNRIDIWVSSPQEAKKFGRRKVRLRVI